jgi:DNA-binding response OmpR family regulator
VHTSSMTSILVVDDEQIVRDVVARYLERDGFTTVVVADGEAARTMIERESPSLVVLDVMLPGLDGLSLCRWIRARSDVPVILLTARGEEADRIVGLELGADDYVTKPFSPRELAARVRAVLRRSSPAAEDRAARVEIGKLRLDPNTREVHKGDELLKLTVREFDLLWFLGSNPNRVFSRAQLMDRVWGYSSAVDTGTVTVHVRRLREKVEQDPSRPLLLETVWGAGYRLRA